MEAVLLLVGFVGGVVLGTLLGMNIGSAPPPAWEDDPVYEPAVGRAATERQANFIEGLIDEIDDEIAGLVHDGEIGVEALAFNRRLDELVAACPSAATAAGASALITQLIVLRDAVRAAAGNS